MDGVLDSYPLTLLRVGRRTSLPLWLCLLIYGLFSLVLDPYGPAGTKCIQRGNTPCHLTQIKHRCKSTVLEIKHPVVWRKCAELPPSPTDKSLDLSQEYPKIRLISLSSFFHPDKTMSNWQSNTAAHSFSFSGRFLQFSKFISSSPYDLSCILLSKDPRSNPLSWAEQSMRTGWYHLFLPKRSVS